MRRSLIALAILLGPAANFGVSAEERPKVGQVCEANNFKIGVDIGHSTDAPGAISARGVPEYAFNLKLATLIADELRAAGFEKTKLISARGSGQSQLLSRTAQANSLGLDLFLSIHHDAVQNVYLDHWVHDGVRRAYSDRFAGYSLFISMQNPVANKSLSFARLLGHELRDAKLRSTLHHAENIPGERRQVLDPTLGIYRYDQLVVLKNNKAPSVLLEAGVILNREEEEQLAGAERQQVTAQAVIRAVRSFCQNNLPKGYMPHD